MKKRIFSILVSLLMITSLVGIANAETQTEVPDVINYDISESYDCDTIAGNGDIVGETWFDGYTGLNANNVDGLDKAFFGTKESFNARNFDNTENISVYIPNVGRNGGENDALALWKNKTLEVTLEAVPTKTIRYLANNTEATVNATITYTDGTTLVKSVGGTNLPTTYYTYKDKSVWYMFTNGKLAVKGDNNVIALQGGKTAGLIAYDIALDSAKTPLKVVFTNASTARPVYFYSVSQVSVSSAEMLAAIETARAYTSNTAAFAAEEIAQIILANSYADILVAKNAVTEESVSDIRALLERANKQKAISEVSHFDISKDYNADTIGGVGETAGDTWFDGYTGLNANNIDGLDKAFFGTKESFNARNFDNTENISVYIPNVGRNGGENDALALWKNKTLEVTLEAVPTKTIRYLANNTEATVNATITYTDGTTLVKSVGGTNLPTTYYTYKDKSVWYMFTNGKLAVKGDNNVIALQGGKTAGLIAYDIALDSAKTPLKVVFTNASTARPVYFYSVSQVSVSSAEMLAAIETARAYTSNTAAFAAEEIAQIILANSYADILVAKNAVTEESVSDIRALLERANKQKAISEVSHFDISKDYNADTIGGVGETANETWFDGFTGFSGNFNGFNKTAFGTKEYFEAALTKVGDNGKLTSTGETLPVYIPNVGRSAGKVDSAALWKGKTLTVDLNDVPTETIRFLANNAGISVKATIYYKDGATDEKSIDGKDYASLWHTDKNTSVAYLGTGYTFVNKEANNTLSLVRDVSTGLILYNFEADASKIADKVVFSVASDTKPVYFYSVSQVPVSYETMKAALDAKFSGVYTDEDEATANKLANYKAVLTDAGAIASTDYPMVENYIKQANSQKNTYVDLTSYLNDDIMVKLGDSYAGITLGRTTELFDGERIPTDGMITMLPPSDPTQMSDETGRTYKLSGAYNGKGNDSVLIRKTDENGITIAVPEANGKVKGMGVILETNGGNDGTAVLVDATVNYSDNTSADIKVYLQRSHGFNTAKMAAHSKDFGRLVINSDNTVANHEKWPNVDRVSFYSSNIEFDTDKTVSSITFKPCTSDDYHIVAMTEYVYTNTELWDFVNAMSANDISGITKENADETIKGCEAVIELYNRGFTADIQEEDCSSYTQMLNYAKALKADEASVDINVTIAEDGNNMKATAAMSNTTANAQDYVIVIAAYKGNKLVGLNISAQGTLQSGDVNKTDSVSLEKIEGAQYKAFVWESMSSLKPIYKAN